MSSPLLSDAGCFTPDGLAAPAARAVAALLAERLDRVEKAYQRLGDSQDTEALHDFRVALRRLRSLIRIYRGLIGQDIPERLVRRLRRIARATNLSRDLEVKLQWLEGQKATLRPKHQVGFRWLEARLEQARREAGDRAMEEVEADYQQAVTGLRRRIADLGRRTMPGEPTCAMVTGALLRALESEMDDHLARVASIADQAEAHEARIVGKQLRYLLEPLAEALPEAGELAARCKAMQDVLGDMHDADVAAGMLADAMEAAAAEGGARVAQELRGGGLDAHTLRRARRKDPVPGLLALIHRVQERREDRWRAFAAEWHGQRHQRLFAPLLDLAEGLVHVPVANVEIERKYLLSALPERVRDTDAVDIEQGYLPGQVIQERLRRVRGRGGVRCFRTVKLGAGVARQEFEEDATEELFEAFWPHTEGRRLTKRRYRVVEGDLTWEVDEFTDRDLVLAEVELDAEHHHPELPAWLAPLVVREVTDDPAYVNINLAR
jgi:CHAD domain-containing protein/CYTH domain-containing protein